MSVTKAKTDNIVSLDASQLSGTLPAMSGAALTGIEAVTKNASDPTISTNPSGGVGTLWANTTSGEMYACTDATAGANLWINVGAGSGDVAKPFGGLGGGTVSGYSCGGGAPTQDTIEKYSFASSIVVADHGNMAMGRDGAGSCSSAIDGYTHGGYISGPPGGVGGFRDNIDRFSFATNSTATDHGNMTVARVGTTGCNSSTNGYSVGGHLGPSNIRQNTIDTFTFGSNSNSTLHGDMSDAGRARGCGQSSNTDGYHTGGEGAANTRHNIIEKFSFTSNVVATDIADITAARNYGAGISSTTHGYTASGETSSGGSGASETIDRFSFGSGVNATDHGDCSIKRAAAAGSSSTTHGFVAAGSQPSVGATKSIDKFSFSSNVTAADHGDLAATETGGCGCQV